MQILGPRCFAPSHCGRNSGSNLNSITMCLGLLPWPNVRRKRCLLFVSHPSSVQRRTAKTKPTPPYPNKYPHHQTQEQAPHGSFFVLPAMAVRSSLRLVSGLVGVLVRLRLIRKLASKSVKGTTWSVDHHHCSSRPDTVTVTVETVLVKVRLRVPKQSAEKSSSADDDVYT